jgi:hypothetical protein
MRSMRCSGLGVLALVAAALAPARASAQGCGAAPTLAPQLVGIASCQLTALGLVPLSELGCQLYQGFEGGLYPGGTNAPPAAHAQLGALARDGVRPRDAQGAIDEAGGLVGFASIGMSNTSMEFSRFVPLAQADPLRAPQVVVVDGAQPGETANVWAHPDSGVWDVFDERLAAAGLAPAQLQVIWLKQAVGRPDQYGAFPDHAELLRDLLGDVVRVARDRYPNLRIAYLSSRTRAYTTVLDTLNPEPFAYESAFAVKWLIEAQIAGDPALHFDPLGGGEAPWLAWGPYLWADGETPRSDGFDWPCSAVSAADFVHPSHDGRDAVAGLLLDFVHEAPSAGWYRTAPEPAGGALAAGAAGALLALRSSARRREDARVGRRAASRRRAKRLR